MGGHGRWGWRAVSADSIRAPSDADNGTPPAGWLSSLVPDVSDWHSLMSKCWGSPPLWPC